MQCNIDAKGKLVRLLSGAMVVIMGLVLAVIALLGVIGGVWVWLAVAVTIASGLFQIYEGWCGWCVLRAMGFRTPV